MTAGSGWLIISPGTDGWNKESLHHGALNPLSRPPEVSAVMKRAYLVVLHLLVYFTAFMLAALARRATLDLPPRDWLLLAVFLPGAMLTALLAGKFRPAERIDFRSHLNSFILLAGILAGLVFLLRDFYPSRKIIFFALTLAFFFDSSLRILRRAKTEKLYFQPIPDFSPAVFLLFFLPLVLVLILAGWDQKLSSSSLWLPGGALLCWLISGWHVRRFQPIRAGDRFWHTAWRHLKADLLFLALLSFFIYMVRPAVPYVASLLPAGLVYVLLAQLLLLVVFLPRLPRRAEEIRDSLLNASYALDHELITVFGEPAAPRPAPPAEATGTAGGDAPFRPLFIEYPGLREYLEKTLELKTFKTACLAVQRTADPYNVEILPEEWLQLYLNLKPLNDQRRIDRYLEMVNRRLLPGGYFVGVFEPLSLRLQGFLAAYPFYLARLFYFFDFLWHRACPKLPFFQSVYFALGRGRGRVISLAECLGRLHRAGFELVSLRRRGRQIWFTARRSGPPEMNDQPSYGPLIRLNRLGRDGREIRVFKLRTMYPYSEYIQDLVCRTLGTEAGGKFSNDFRVTSWGRFLRRFWLDELPMVLNLLKGELKLVGVRPLSRHYFSLYPEEAQKRRLGHKPGLIPPFYADLPCTLEEIVLSEMKYLDAWEKNPRRTDLKYFFKALGNIILRGARSN